MARNARPTNDLQDEDDPRPPAAGETDDAGAPPPFTFTPLGADPALGWAGWGAGAMAPWTRAQAELVHQDDEEQDPPRREPRER